jgi:hypothetical protein
LRKIFLDAHLAELLSTARRWRDLIATGAFGGTAYWEPFPIYWPHFYRHQVRWNRIPWMFNS